MHVPSTSGLISTEDVQAAKDDLLEFAFEMMPTYNDNWHHRLICDRLTALLQQQRQRLMIFVPPQYGKSLLVSRLFPAWWLGHKPHSKIILASYSSDLADGFNRDAQRYMDSPIFRQIFPECLIQTKSIPESRGLKRTGNICETSAGGYFYTVGVGGSTTGKTADPLFIIDDPIKDFKEADSDSIRKSKIDWFNGVCQTRLPPTANVIIMHTRWHEQDLGGYLLDRMKKDPKASKYEVIDLPAVCIEEEKHEFDPRKDGEALWPDHKGTEEELDQIMRDVGERTWWSLYQQRPRIKGGNLVKSDYWQRYSKLPERIDEWCLALDSTFKGIDSSDYVVIVVWCRSKNNYYKVDQLRRKMDINQTVDGLIRMAHKWPKARAKVIETKANGPAVIDHLKNEMSGIIPFDPRGSKESRVNAVVPEIEGGNAWLPKSEVAYFNVEVCINEWSSFPNGKHDDIVDADTMAIARLSRHQRGYLRRMVTGMRSY